MIDPTGHEVHGPELDPPDQNEVTEVPVEVPEEPHVASNVCETCSHDNLLQKVGIVYCSKCSAPFCIHFASKIDPQYCVDCCSEVSMTKNSITYERQVYNEQTDTTRTYRRRAKEIHIEGFDWLFMQRKIYTLSDAELDLAIEYHRNYQSLLLVEAEARRNQKAHRNANVKIVMPTHSTQTTTTTVKKSTNITSTKAQAQVSGLFSSLLAKGLTVDQIQAIVAQLQGKK